MSTSRRSTASVALPALALTAAFGVTSGALAGVPAPTATYELIFDATWSAQTHPDAYPNNAHFSPMIGGTHSMPGQFWTPGGISTSGMEQMAETGGTSGLRSEVQTAIFSGLAGVVIEDNVAPDSPGMAAVTFEASQAFPLATVVTMIAPSPDWYVGTDSTPLFQNGHWRPEVTVTLFPWDAGTDSGTEFVGPNQNTNPHDPIALITGYPFAGPGTPVVPLGTFTFRRVDAPPCPTDVTADGTTGFDDIVALLAAWGPSDDSPADIDGNGMVDFTDLVALLAGFGPCG